MNTDSQVGMKTKFNYQKGEGYIFEAFTAKKIQKTKKASREIYTPRVYARTPDKEFVEFTGSVEHVEGKSIRVDVKLDKVTKRPFTATGNPTITNEMKGNNDVIHMLQSNHRKFVVSLDSIFGSAIVSFIKL